MDKTTTELNMLKPTESPNIKGPNSNPPTLEELKEIQNMVNNQEKESEINYFSNQNIIYFVNVVVIILVVMFLLKKIKK